MKWPIVLSVLGCLLYGQLLSQTTFTGQIEDENHHPISGATVWIVELNKGVSSDADGKFHLKALPKGAYTLEVSFLGYEKQNLTLVTNKTRSTPLIITLVESVERLKTVTVVGKSNEQLKREEPIKIEVIGVSKVLEQSSSLPELINQTSGVKVRQSSGIGP